MSLPSIFERKFHAEGKLTKMCFDLGITDLHDLLLFTRNLPYGRNSNRHDFSLVLKERKGTCSSKHAMVKVLAAENEMCEVQLILCMYKMTAENTPGITRAIADYSLDFIPEAHCFLKIGQENIDITSEFSDISNIENDILDIRSIEAFQVSEEKVNIHKDYIRKWLPHQDLKMGFEELWSIRESCIEALSK